MTRLAPDDLALKATTRALTDACGGSEACAVLLGKSASLIRSYGNPNVPDRFMPANDILALERFAGRPIVTAWGVERHKVDPDRPRRRIEPSEDIVRVAKEASEAKLAVIAANTRRRADGTFGAADRALIAREMRELAATALEIADAAEEAL